MMLVDPISDMLTRIRNANALRYEKVSMPSSKMKVEIAKILKEEGFISDYDVTNDKVKKVLTIVLKYGPKHERVINGLKKISKPGLRVTSDSDHLPRVLKGLGIAIISTSKGVMTDAKARALGVGGEVIAYIY
ncbi:MAG: 30S ribosomal protein S8 [Bacilli bacterium]|nr:30S ribosomal protein S8 [Bacilli bacterium]